MIVRLDDPILHRRLRTACRRTGEVRRRRRWWRSAQRDLMHMPLVTMILRIGLCVVISSMGFLVPHARQGGQLLTLIAVLTANAWIQRLRGQLTKDQRLAVLIQLPISPSAIFDHQMRPFLRGLVWPAVDAAGFWTAAWTSSGVPWAWLPAVVAAHVAVTMVVVLLLWRVLPDLGCLLYAICAFLFIAMTNLRDMPHLGTWANTDVIIDAIRWATPWGWVNGVAMEVPRSPLAGVPIALLAAIAAVLAIMRFRRLRTAWRPAPPWLELASMPRQSFEPSEPPSPGAASAMVVQVASAAANQPTAESHDQSDATARVAWRTTSSVRRGNAFTGLGWAGDRARERCDAEDLWLADFLRPKALGGSRWMWALQLVAPSTLCAVIGISGRWAIPMLLAIAWVRKARPMSWLLVCAAASFVVCTLYPESTVVIAYLLPCLVAIILSVPMLGGFPGLPMAMSPLGGVPRSYWRLFRIVAWTTMFQLIASLPIVLLAVVTIGVGVHPKYGVMVAEGGILRLLAVPWLSGLLVVSTAREGVDFGLSWRLDSIMHFAAFIVLLIGMTIPFICTAVTVKSASDISLRFVEASSLGVAVLASISLLQLPLMRYTYRRRMDIVPVQAA